MTWERPGAWALLALALPIVVLHLRWRRRRVADVPSLVVWRGLGPEGAGRRGLRAVEDAVQLVVLLAALAAFTAALAGPVAGDAAGPPRRLAILLDVSASMGARAGDRTRFDEARDAAVSALARMGPRDDVVVWAASSEPRVAVEPTRDLAAARAAIAAIRPTLAPSGTAVTLDLARRALGPGSAILLLTDVVGAAQVESVLLPGETAGIAGGADAANSGISAVAVDAADARVRIRVVRTDGDPAVREALLVRDGTVVARVPLAPDAEADADLPLGALAGSGGPVEVRLAPGDDFAPDDVAALVLPAPRRLRVAVCAEGGAPSRFLLDALRAMPEAVDAERAILVGPDAPAGAFASCDVIVADGAVPSEAPRDRPVLEFGAAGRAVEQPLLWGVGAHPVLAGVDLSPLRIGRANVLPAAAGERVLAECAEGPVAVAEERDGVRRIRLGFRPDATTLPLEAAFPVLVRNALAWLGRPPLLPPAVRAGSPIVPAEPLPAAERLWVEGPGDLPPRPVRVRDGALAEVAPVPSPEGPRILRLRLPGGAAETAVNWHPPPGFRVSGRVARLPPAADALRRLPDRSGDADTRRSLAPHCAAAGAAALAAAAALLRPSRRRAGPDVAVPREAGAP